MYWPKLRETRQCFHKYKTYVSRNLYNLLPYLRSPRSAHFFPLSTRQRRRQTTSPSYTTTLTTQPSVVVVSNSGSRINDSRSSWDLTELLAMRINGVLLISALPQILSFQSTSSLFGLGKTNFLRSTTVSNSDAINGSPTSSSNVEKTQPVEIQTGKVALVVCPAQFCVPDDYNILFDNLRQVEGLPQLGTCVVPPLPRTEWIKVARKLPTKEFLDAKLAVHETLEWYFTALEKAIADVFAKDGPDVNLCIIGHSIGGWVARAYLGGLSR